MTPTVDRGECPAIAGSPPPAGSPGTAPPSPAAGHELCFKGARELAGLLRGGAVTAGEVMAAHLAQIARVNPALNAIVAKLEDEQCLALARAADARRARGEPPGPLHGLPWAFKDLEAAVGFPNTRGSTVFAGDRPGEDSVLVERLRQAGVLPIGKTNVPEFGMGSQTYNAVYGTTLNAWDRTKTAGGSSGGAAVAVATGMLPGADGSDLGGSLRNPANFNNVVGFRPSVGLVPTAPNLLPFLGFAVKGPIARTVADAAFLLSAMAGPDPRDPACYPVDPAAFAGPLEQDFKGVRIAWCPDLGGLPLEPRVRTVLDGQRGLLESLGCIVEDACPDLAGADETFLTLRAWRSWHTLGPLLVSHRGELKPEAIGEIEAGARLTAADVGRAMIRHGQLLESMRRFEERHAFLVAAVNQVAPFDATLHWPRAIAGERLDHYIAWMKSAYWITATFRPAISVPAGFTVEGLPVGMQIVGRYRDDLGVLKLAHAFELATRVGWRRPPVSG